MTPNSWATTTLASLSGVKKSAPLWRKSRARVSSSTVISRRPGQLRPHTVFARVVSRQTQGILCIRLIWLFWRYWKAGRTCTSEEWSIVRFVRTELVCLRRKGCCTLLISKQAAALACQARWVAIARLGAAEQLPSSFPSFPRSLARPVPPSVCLNHPSHRCLYSRGDRLKVCRWAKSMYRHDSAAWSYRPFHGCESEYAYSWVR